MNLIPMDIKGDDSVAPSNEFDASPCIYLTDDQVEALGIKGMPAPGAVFMLQARAVVQSVTASAEEPEESAAEGAAPDVSLSLRLVAIALQPGGKSSTEMAASLYG